VAVGWEWSHSSRIKAPSISTLVLMKKRMLVIASIYKKYDAEIDGSIVFLQ
jgi:hypothetical protein